MDSSALESSHGCWQPSDQCKNYWTIDVKFGSVSQHFVLHSQLQDGACFHSPQVAPLESAIESLVLLSPGTNGSINNMFLFLHLKWWWGWGRGKSHLETAWPALSHLALWCSSGIVQENTVPVIQRDTVKREKQIMQIQKSSTKMQKNVYFFCAASND